MIVKHEFIKSVLTDSIIKVTIHYMKLRAVIVNTENCGALLEKPELFCSEVRLIKARSIADPARRLQSLAAELALSYALFGEKLGAPLYSYDEKGRPVIGGGFISLAHSGRFAAAAFSDAPVGVDIEEYRAVSPKAAQRVLCPRELAGFEKPGGEKYRIDRFVIKEAFLKMTGDGVWGGLDRVYEKDGAVFRRGVLSGFVRAVSDSGFSFAAVTAAIAETEIVIL